MNTPAFKRLGLVVAVCALAGALAGIAGSAAAPSKKSSKSKPTQAQKNADRRARALRMPGPPPPFAFGIGGPPVHSETVVPNADGTGFDTITTDAGKLKSIDGSKLTVTEGTDKATYKTPTIDVGSDAKVFRNHEKAALGDLKENDFVRIVQGPKGTLVWAEDADFQAKEKQMRPRFFGRARGHRHFGPGGPGMPPPPPGGGSEGGSDPGDSALGDGGSNS
jgi:hypothetical protein